MLRAGERRRVHPHEEIFRAAMVKKITLLGRVPPGDTMHFRLTPPRILILFVSLILAAAAVATLYMHVPIFGHYVATHRFWVMTAAYTVLLAGVVFEGL
jgi:hypothetical protein